MSDSDVQITFSASVDDVNTGIAQVRQSLQGLTQPISGISKSLSGVSAGFDTTIQGMNAQIRVLRTGLQEQKTVLDAEAQQHQITENEKYAQLEAETQKEYEAELTLLQQELQIQNLKPQQIQAINAKIEQLQAQHDLKMVQLDEQSIAASQKQWDGYFSTIEGAFNSQIKGLIVGTTSWGSAFKSVLTDLLVSFIEMVEKMVFQWAAGEIAQTTATTTGAAARVAAQNSANVATSATTLSSIAQSITASASETFAGIFGFLSPVMGPGAAGPAAAGQATVMAAAHFDQGSWQLPSDMLAQVHKGEMIVPAAQTPWAQSLMANAAGSASGQNGAVHVHPTTNFHVSALDSGSVSQWMKSNSAAMMKAMDEAVRHGANLGLRRLSNA